MEYLASILEKIAFIIILMGAGVLTKRLGWVSDAGERDLSILSVDFVLPCMVFASICTSLTAGDITANLPLPLLSFAMHLAGFGTGLLVCRFTGYTGDRRKMFLFHAALNNFLVMALPFVQGFFSARGVALLAVANLGSILFMWTVGVYIMAGAQSWRTTLRNIFSPAMTAILLSIICVMSGLNRSIPPLAIDVLRTIGEPTMLIGLMVAGFRISGLGFRALRFDGWNMLVGLVRNIIVPGIVFLFALAMRGHMDPVSLAVFCLIGITPASVNSVTLGIKYHTDPDLAAEGVVFTHFLCIGTMLAWVALIERFIIAGQF